VPADNLRQAMPPSVFEDIQLHLREAGNSDPRDVWAAASEDEDTLTGEVGALLRQPRSSVFVTRSVWHWRVDYTKFRGRGSDALEHHTGADGLFSVEVWDAEGNGTVKGLLFQAKKGRVGRAKELREQVTEMERIVPGVSAVFEYNRELFRAARGTSYLEAVDEGLAPTRETLRGLGDFLADDFLECESGALGLYYDANRRNLVLPTLPGPVHSRIDGRILVSVIEEPVG
jgi:hypothetical protein